jgi:hypothetical protein
MIATLETFNMEVRKVARILSVEDNIMFQVIFRMVRGQ